MKIALSILLFPAFGLSAGPPNSPPPAPRLVVVPAALKQATVVLHVSYVSASPDSFGVRWETVRIHSVIKNNSHAKFGETLRVAVVPGRSLGGVPNTAESLIYLIRYKPPYDDQWLLRDASL